MQWSSASVFVLRHAGFPAELVTALSAPELTADLARIDRLNKRVRACAEDLRAALGDDAGPNGARAVSRTGQFQSVQDVLPDVVRPAAGVALRDYEDALTDYGSAWDDYLAKFERHLDDQRGHVVGLFQNDSALREVLFLSNDARFAQFDSWLTGFTPGKWSRTARRMADLLVMYLQRVSTKNETTSHFGPFAVGRFTSDQNEVSWRNSTELTRYTYPSHWAVEELGRALARHEQLWEHVRPRRNPWLLAHGDDFHHFAFTTLTGMPSDWNFVEMPEREWSTVERALIGLADGTLTLREIRERLAMTDAAELLRTVDELVRSDVLFAHFEIPIGDPAPLRTLDETLARCPEPLTAEPRAQLAELDRLVDDFGTAAFAGRVRILDELKTRFTEHTGVLSNRSAGRHYGDRSVLYEECHSWVRDLRAGRVLEEFVSDELSIVYDLLLIGPRYRSREEHRILSRWTEDTFGADTPVPLVDFYRAYFADRSELTTRCAEVTAEIDALNRETLEALLRHGDPRAAEIEVPRAAVEEIIAAHPTSPRAVCNPDVMLAAADAEALNRGDFTAVVGDCHAMREILTHTSFSPIVAECHPGTVAEMNELYATLIEPGEMLCDVARSHRDKTGTQLVYPGPDVEFYGLSPKNRSEVIRPEDLFVIVRDGRIELRARGHDRRLRLQAPPASGPSISTDPLSVFSFPRHFGGLVIPPGALAHLPRIRCGRTVLQRRTWWVSASQLSRRRVGTLRHTGDAAEFYAAADLRETFGLPERVFVSVPGEPKPCYVDFSSPLLVRQMFRLGKKSEGVLRFSEVLPDLDNLWLDVDGKKYTSELRCAVFSR